MGFEKPNQNLTSPQLVKKYLTTVRRSKNTQLIYSNVLKQHLAGKPLPTNPNSRGIHIRTINACWNWGLKNDLVKETKDKDQTKTIQELDREKLEKKFSTEGKETLN